MATLETSLEANYDIGQTDGQEDKATYRGTSYRSAQKYSKAKNTIAVQGVTRKIHPRLVD